MTNLRFLLRLQGRLVRRDAPVLVAFALLALVALLCASAGPQLLTAELDAATRHALAAGSSTDVVVRTGVGNAARGTGRFLVAPEQVDARADDLRSRLPGALRAATRPPTAAVVGPDQRITADDARPALQNGPVGVSIALIPDARAIRLRSGALPGAAAPGVVDVVLSQAAADASSLRVGSVADLPPSSELLPGERLRIRVTGIIDRVGGTAAWADLGPVWEPRRNRNGTAAPLQIVALTDAAGLGSATDALGPFPAVLRLRVRAERLTAAEAHVVARQVRALRANPDPIVVSGQEALRVTSSLPEAIAQAEQEARSARAQFLLLTAGVLGTAAVALVLLGGLVAARRREVVDLQRARGASVLGVALPALLESAVVVLAAAVVAALVTRAVGVPETAVIGVVALLATPVALAALAARGAVRRAPANRSDRTRVRRLRRTRRAASEVGLVAIAVVALLVLDAGAGLGGAQPNPLLLVAPLLLAAATTLVVLRLVPPVLRGVALLARRSRGVAGILVSARAGRRGAALPVLALCLATGLALNDGMLLASVAAGQEAAAWERIGADARTNAAVDVDRLRAQPGVRAAAEVVEIRGTSVDLATTSTTATLLAVDQGFSAVVAAVPGTAGTNAPVLRRLDGATVLPVVVDRTLARLMVGRTLRLRLDSGTVAARAVGVLPADLPGVAPGQTVVADLAALRSRSADPGSTRTLAVGPGAGAALAAASASGSTVTTRTRLLAEQRAAPLVAGTRQATLLAAGALALLAAVALSTAVLAGAPERRRTLALLRTLGMPRQAGWWLLLADLLPLVLGGVVGGAAVGVLAAAVFDPVLSLAALTGGRADPPVVLSAGVAALVLAGLLAVLGATVGIERLTWRRDRFDEVLRAGGRG
ncbi:FtsX-like permease family protein [Amnibacterium kyonggiense]|uniref:Putative ABC transport system permease protein n=1 Tax=Amnibacterium kyonggiense TaxID=595671 RepID=A0A4R7FGK1_9MICO|nr:FtsX-like permease family protein [Amnibacterium kyonggiense]TDS75825.1 putative ABC transport system permease protein [Amnibacterium kyonggiense]